MQLDAGIQINIAWQLLAYVIITMAEVFCVDYLLGVLLYTSTEKDEIFYYVNILVVCIFGKYFC